MEGGGFGTRPRYLGEKEGGREGGREGASGLLGDPWPGLHRPSSHCVGAIGCSSTCIVTKSSPTLIPRGVTRFLEKVEFSKIFSRSMPTLKQQSPHRQGPIGEGVTSSLDLRPLPLVRGSNKCTTKKSVQDLGPNRSTMHKKVLTPNPPPKNWRSNPNKSADRFFGKTGSQCPGSQSQASNTPPLWLLNSCSHVETQNISQFSKKFFFRLSVCTWSLSSCIAVHSGGLVVYA